MNNQRQSQHVYQPTRRQAVVTEGQPAYVVLIRDKRKELVDIAVFLERQDAQRRIEQYAEAGECQLLIVPLVIRAEPVG